MTTVERTVASLRRRRRIGLGLVWATPVVTTTTLLLWQGPLGGLSLLPLVAGAGAWPVLRQDAIGAARAGRLLDRAAGGKDHFLTLATLAPGSHPLQPVLRDQTARLAAGIRLADVVPPLPWRSAAGTAAGALLVFLLVLAPGGRTGLPERIAGPASRTGPAGEPGSRLPASPGAAREPDTRETSGSGREPEPAAGTDAGAASPLARSGGGEGSQEQEQGGGAGGAGASGGSGTSGGPGAAGESPSGRGSASTGAGDGGQGETRTGAGQASRDAGDASRLSGERQASGPAGRSPDEAGGAVEPGAAPGEAQSGTGPGTPREGSGSGTGPGSGQRPAPDSRTGTGSATTGDLPGWIIRDGGFVRVRVPQPDDAATDVRTVPGPGRPEARVAPGNAPPPSDRETPAGAVHQPIPLEYREVLREGTTDRHGKGS